MDNKNRIRELLGSMAVKFDFYERQPGKYQLILPILHEDSDMVDIYLVESPRGEGYIRLCDFGLTLMRLSYTLDMTETRQRILDSVLINNDVQNDTGNLYLDAPIAMLYESILQFAGCIQKVCNIRYWHRESIRGTFYDDLEQYITTELKGFNPIPKQSPISTYPIISVDWYIKHNKRKFYLFGVPSNDKAKVVTIAILELKKKMSFISMVIYENMEELGRKERLYITKNADKHYPVLSDFQEKATDDINRLAA